MEQLLTYIKNELHHSSHFPFLISIDGNCGSGKTTLADFLQKHLKCSLFHMDDFFLPPPRRTKERLSEPGGNVDYERFKEEVLDHISDRPGLSFHPVRHHNWDRAPSVFVPYHDIVIVEGSYSRHPYFGDAYHVKIFLEISPEEQKKRIIARDGEAIWPMFEQNWIPMEHQYFKAFQIRENSTIVAKFSESESHSEVIGWNSH